MGRHLRRKHSSIPFENNHPGCMWGILHILDYHHWHNVKKMLPHKRHGGGRHAVGVGSPGNNLNAPSAGEMQEHINDEMESSLIKVKMAESIPATKSSVKARIKALIAEEMSKRRTQHHRMSTYPTQSQLTRTDSIHHLEPSDQDPLAEIILNDESPRIHPNNENSSAISTLNPLLPKACEEPVTSNKNSELCGTMLTVNYLENSQAVEHEKQLGKNHTLPQETLDKVKQDLLEQKLICAKEPTRDASLHRSKKSLDAVDIFNISKELFLKILEDPSSPLAHHFHGQQAFSTKIGLTKSVSFPVVDSSSKMGPSKLEHKQEIGSHAKGEGKLQVGSQTQKLAEFESTEDRCEWSMPLIAEYRVDGIPKSNLARPEISDNSSPVSPHRLKNQGEHQVVIKRFKDLKQKIKHAIKESRKERHRITMDAILHKIPHGHRFSKVVKEIGDQWKEPVMDRDSKDSPRSSCESVHSVPALCKGGPRHIRRTSSLNESLDRYCQLFESSFNREAKHHISERLKLRTEEVGSPGGSAPKSMGRILSLPDLKSYFYLQSEDSSDALSSGTPIRTVVDSTIIIGLSNFDEQQTLGLPLTSENRSQLDAHVESRSQEHLIQVGELYPVIGVQVGSTSDANAEAIAKVGWTVDDLGNLTTGECASCHEQDIGPTNSPTTKLAEPSPISVLDSSFQEDIIGPAKFSQPQDSELKPRRLLLDGPDSLDNQQHESGMDSPSRVISKKLEAPSKHLCIDFLHVQVDTKDKAEFNYVRDVLQLSGFSGNEFLGTWHSTDQPVDPSVFEEVEGCFLLGPYCSGNKEGGNCYHLLLFDLINEVLMEIYERSFTYCPMPLSSLSHIRPMPVGYHVLEEVWANISWYLSSRPELDQSLDYVASRDLAKGDGWMNLQFDTECVGLEVEDFIFDDLLEELIWT